MYGKENVHVWIAGRWKHILIGCKETRNYRINLKCKILRLNKDTGLQVQSLCPGPHKGETHNE
jgi:hypothetical protein